MGARGCRLVYSQDELRPALEDAVNFSRSGKAIAEEFIDGEEFSLEALVINGEIFLNALADRHIFFRPTLSRWDTRFHRLRARKNVMSL